MRVLFLCRALSVGGAERQLVLLARGLAARGHAVAILSLYAGAMDGEARAAGLPLLCLGKRGRWDNAGVIPRLTQAARAFRPDVVHGYLGVPNLLATIVAPLVGARLVWGVRASDMDMSRYDWLARLVSRIEARAARRADLIVCNAEAGARAALARGFPADRLEVVHNGIDTGRFRPMPEARARLRAEWGLADETPVMAMVARLDPMKGHVTAIAALGDLPELRLAVVGDGPPTFAAELRELAQALGVADRVLWLGKRGDVAEILAASDVACSASVFGEGFSNALGEAMACARPCVATEVGDSAMVLDGLGELVRPGDVAAFAAGVGRLLARVAAEPDLGERCRARIAAKFSPAALAERTEALLAGLLP